jgi:hypothetical protein
LGKSVEELWLKLVFEKWKASVEAKSIYTCFGNLKKPPRVHLNQDIT